MKLQIALLALCGFVFAGVQGETSPVFMWGVDSSVYPALQTVSQPEFSNMMASYLENKLAVVFLENGLTNKDFSCSKSDSSSESCYAKLTSVSPKTYLGSVENPLESLRSVAKEHEYNTVDSTGLLSNPLDCGAGKVVFVNFNDVLGEDRATTLESHDASIAAITSRISCPVVYLYMSAPDTAVNAPKVRSRRATADPLVGTYFRHPYQFLIFYTEALYYQSTLSPPSFRKLNFNAMTITNTTTTEFVVSLKGDGDFNFVIGLAGGYFNMSTVTYEGKTFRSTDVTAPTDFSFSCGNISFPIITTDDNGDYIKFNSFQIQAPFTDAHVADFQFGDSWDCLSFFSPGILMGLLVVALMLSITFIGACWMMDINTMDRFDDPKGKTITINAGE